MALVLAFEGELVRLISAYGPQSGRTLVEKDQFYYEIKDEWSVKGNDELVKCLRNFNGHVGKEIEVFVEDMEYVSEMKKEECCLSSVTKKNCA